MLTIREIAVEDLPEVRKLLAQLGYNLEAAEVRDRYEAVTKAADHSLSVAERNAQVIGLLHLYARPALDKPPEVIVQALVVDEAARGKGVGRMLMEVAERWSGQRASCRLPLRPTLPDLRHTCSTNGLAIVSRPRLT
jgi:GNAT superfamily N-acetyltransferase